MINMNKYQSDIIDQIPKKIRDEILEYIETIPFIKHLIQPEEIRGYAKDRPKYSDLNDDDENKTFDDDRIIVDITKPHILEDMDFFRERAIFFEKNNGRYTNLTPSRNPKSEYALFWKEEGRRWKEGYVRPYDGEWIPGYLYFYWNYTKIWLVEENENNNKKKKRQQAERKSEFPKPWLGDYLFFHYVDQARKEGQHGKLLKMRGCGWSFKAAAISPCNMYIFPGTGNVNFHLASEKTFLLGDKGVFGKVVDNLDYIAKNTPLPSLKLTDSIRSMEIQFGYSEDGLRKGLLSSVNGISLKDNPEKARGIRGPFIQYEEDGLFPDLITAWGVNREAVESGSSSFGFMMAGGTGGTEGASFEGSRKLFYEPDAYNIYSVDNVYDKNVQGGAKCGFFWGAYMNRHRCYDEITGEPDVIKAMFEIIENRHKIASNSNDPAPLTQARAEKPITPQEAIMRVEGTIFPVADLSDYLQSIKPEEARFIGQHYVGDLIYDPVLGVIWKPNADLKPLRTHEVDKNRQGAVEIFELPKRGADGRIQSGRYIAGIDPIDADEGKSLFSILVMDLLTDRIVAEYTGRYAKAEQCYEIALKLCMFYNCQANYENNLKGLHTYFKHKNALHYLADTPEILKDMDMLKPSMSNPKGTRSTKPINAWGRQLQVTWQLSEAYNNEDGTENRKLNLHTIRSLGYIEECMKWNEDGNFDRVSAGNMLFIFREDRLRQRLSLRKEVVKTKKSWADSKFFEGVYGNKTGNIKEKYKSIFDEQNISILDD